jgi:hypothetical protein
MNLEIIADVTHRMSITGMLSLSVVPCLFIVHAAYKKGVIVWQLYLLDALFHLYLVNW